MRLLYVCNEYPPAPHGGIGTFVAGLAQALARMGHQISVVGYDPTCATTVSREEQGVDVVRLRKPAWPLPDARLGRYQVGPSFLLDRLYLSRKVAEIVRLQRCDLVESYDWSGPLWFSPPVPLIVRLHGSNTAHSCYEDQRPGRLLSRLERRNILLGDRLVAVSDHVGELTQQALGFPRLPYGVIYNGVDIALFSPGEHSGRDPDLILYAGTIQPRKGLGELFQAMSAVFRAHPSANLMLAGRLPEDGGSYQKHLLGLVPSEFHPSINFLGVVPYAQMPDLYRRAALAVFPSRAEAFGLTCAEAMSCGAPVVMTSRASGPELVEHRVSGILANPADSAALAGALIELLKDATLRQSLSVNAVERVRIRFALSKVLQQNLDEYQALLT